MNGKGSKRRPSSITRAEEALRWEAIFGKKDEEKDSIVSKGNVVLPNQINSERNTK